MIASTNSHKIREYSSLLQIIPNVNILNLNHFPTYIPPDETGTSFEANAIIKASHAADSLKMLTLGDDGGLVIPALEGEPGLYSRRYAGPHATDSENIQKILEKISLLPDTHRSAHFVCALALASPEELKKCVVATCEGEVLDRAKGNYGFAYDKIFLKYGYHKTFGELEESIKNKISHRNKAFMMLLPTLQTSLQQQ
ncbi:MAG: RdgB/HAM1 family non-canonical purine NTP pyrophosphatase [Chlamydiales bacterium]